MNNPLVSIIMPVYNAEKYLELAISDVIGQTYSDFELICIDDGSTDDSFSVMNKFAQNDKRIKIISQDNHGAGQARNVGMDNAVGKYIAFWDADDRYDKSLLEIAVSEAEKNCLDIMIYGGGCFNTIYDVEIESDWIIREDLLPSKDVFSYKDCPDVIMIISPNSVWNKLYRKSFIDELGLLFQNTPYLNDAFFSNIAIVRATRIKAISQKLYWYRMGNDYSISNASVRQKNPDVIFKVTDATRKYLVDNGLYETVERGFNINVVNHYLDTLDMITGDVFVNTYERIKSEIEKINFDYTLLNERFSKQKIDTIKKKSAIEYAFLLLEIYKQGWRINFVESAFFRKKKKWELDSSFLKKGDKVVIYGAGDVGTDYYEQLKREGVARVVAWVDKNYKSINKEIPVQSPDILSDISFDYLIIAVAFPNTKKEIIDGFAHSVPAGKIR